MEVCPSDEEVLALVCGALEATALARVLHHTERCGACALVIAEAGLVRGETEPHPVSLAAARPSAVFTAGQLVASRYLIQRRLGRGGMGEVYEALDRELNERVALKTIATSLADDPRAVQRLKLELRLARSVSHPHVGRVFELGRHELSADTCQWFFTLQLIEGASLRHRLVGSGPPPLGEALTWAEQLARGLAAIHAQNVVHRDIKPENVMLTSVAAAAEALWVDFGLARVDLIDTRSPGLLQGTPDYAAPELLRGAVASRASDLYAFGVLLHELFTGALPFSRSASFGQTDESARSRALPLRARGAELPPEVDWLVRQCLDCSPERRPESALNVAEALRDAAQRVADAQVGSAEGARSRAAGLTLLAAVLAAASAAIALASRPSGAPSELGASAVEPDPIAARTAAPAIASTPPAPPRGDSLAPRAVPRRSASIAPSSSSAVTDLQPPSVTDFGGRR
jgi:serine/threonine-protein kinase